MIYPPTIIDYGTDEDAGFWSDALRFAPFRHKDYPSARSFGAGSGECALPHRSPEHPVSTPFHSSANSPLEQAKHD